MSEHGRVRLSEPAFRLDRLRRFDQHCADLVDRLLLVVRTGLPRMQRSDGTAFVARRYSPARVVDPPGGCSLGYTAVIALGARHLDAAGQRALLGRRSAAEVCDVLVERLSSTNSIGDVALAVRATASCEHEGLHRALARLDTLDAGPDPRRVVDLAWTVSGLVAARSTLDVEHRLNGARSRLLDSLVERAGLFGHISPEPARTPHPRRHASYLADQVHAIQALARLHASSDDPVALQAAARCAERVCSSQGPGGQWWWSYDVRNGRVVEGYPVYTAYQHSLAPMALLDLAEAGGPTHLEAIRRSLAWLEAPPEVSEPLILDRPGLIARKIDRRGPGKIARGLRAALASGSTRRWPPAEVNRECRTDDLGWLLDCWLGGVDGHGSVGSSRPGPGRLN